MPSQVALSSVSRLVPKILCSTFNCLYLFERIFSSSLQRWFSCFFCVCLYYNLEGLFHKKNLKSKRSNYCSLRISKMLFHILLERDYWKFLNYSLARHGLKKVQKIWLCGNWKVARNLLWHMVSETFAH